MAYWAFYKNQGIDFEKRIIAFKERIRNWIADGDTDFKVEEDHYTTYVDAPNTSFVISGLTTEKIMPEFYRDYKFSKAKNFTLYNCRIMTLDGWPYEIFGDLTIEKCDWDFGIKDIFLHLRNNVHGNIYIKECPHLYKSYFKYLTNVDGEIYDDKPETPESEQLVIDLLKKFNYM
ncbi:MAG: hypothetical protein J6T98_08920 [Salinivirgaceae bacterium]|nr:hypothetical protein [Salinivirgaceae bacterium]